MIRSVKVMAFTLFPILQLNVQVFAQKDAKLLVERMVQACGGKEKFYSLGDVQYEYTFQNMSTGNKDVSLEQYVFDGEMSWAKYTTREHLMVPNIKGEMIQGFDGNESWITMDGELIDDPRLHKFADFLRKTNYYWFAMMFKLLDPGVIHEYAGIREIDGIQYDLVKITFEENTGDVQDTFVLYINPDTHMVDQFLFTVLDFQLAEPSLMVVEYDEVEGVKLPARRRYASADWNGNLKDSNWTAEICTKIVFGNGFSKDIFRKPGMKGR